MYRFKFNVATILACFIFLAIPAEAGVVVSGTRVIYPENENEVTVKVTNKGNTPVLIQAWIDEGDQNVEPAKIMAPFVITPPMNRINPDKGQTLRITNINQKSLPDDRESLFWLNVLEIPSIAPAAASKNKLQIAFRTRIKMFYRPSNLKHSSVSVAESLQWSLHKDNLKIQNNSPFHITLLNVKPANGKSEITLPMIKPFDSVTVSVDSNQFKNGMQLYYRFINDYGSVKEAQTTI
ncbi:molecular chaperone [Enterobacter ludwigii]|uniref:fimbrial biogenesis chaperone n=1 Tax=Enterobacter ludwigii TaxID=299767 RepID=UPI003976457C